MHHFQLKKFLWKGTAPSPDPTTTPLPRDSLNSGAATIANHDNPGTQSATDGLLGQEWYTELESQRFMKYADMNM